MNILITGSEGVIGRRLVRYLKVVDPAVGSTYRSERPLLFDSFNICTCDRTPADRPNHTIADITHPETLRKAFTASKPNLVFHLAASVGRRASEAWASVALRTNVEGTQNVVDLCLEYGARLVHVSSSEVYGDAFRLKEKVDESFVCRDQLGIYGLSKWLGEQVVELATIRNGLDSVIARPFMCYSEDEPLTPYRSAIARFMCSILRGEPITVHEGAVRSWCYVDDMVEGLARLGLSELTGVYNVGRQDSSTLALVALMILGIASSMSDICTVPMPEGIYPVKHASFDKIQQDTGWEATTSLEDGLKLVVQAHLPLYERFEVRG